MMKAVFYPVNTDDLEMTLTLTMKMRHWKFLRDNVTPVMGSSEFRNLLEAMIDKAEKNFHHKGIVDSGTGHGPTPMPP